jgi:hypothetical protein
MRSRSVRVQEKKKEERLIQLDPVKNSDQSATWSSQDKI